MQGVSHLFSLELSARTALLCIVERKTVIVVIVKFQFGYELDEVVLRGLV